MYIPSMHTDRPQLITGTRLVRPGESVRFDFFIPAGVEAGDLAVYPNYLEKADPGSEFRAGGDLKWVESLPCESVKLDFTDGRASVEYTPESSGNYLAKWEAGGETFYRYFAVITDDYVVLRFSCFFSSLVNPTLHATGIPLDVNLPADRCVPTDEEFKLILERHRLFGDTIMPKFPDTPEMTVEERAASYGEHMERFRSLIVDPSDGRTIRVEMHHEFDSGYNETFMRLGVNEHCGMWEANAKPWLGMPEFNYFSSPIDCRKPNKEKGGSVVAHQWDFCAGWHFIGPVSWHYAAGEGDWEATEKCVTRGMDELANSTEMSGHPAFAVPLYDGIVGYPKYPNPNFREGWGEEMLPFVEKYQRLIAFDFPKKYKVVFARSIDIADYYRANFEVTPTTIFDSRTDHVGYDKWWLCNWCDTGNLVTLESLPWETRISTIMSLRKTAHPYKDPRSYEYLLIEGQRRQMRFERECPNPVWYFDYANQERGPEGSSITYVVTPDVDIARSQNYDPAKGLTIKLKMDTKAEFPDYAIALWNVPAAFSKDAMGIRTSAKEVTMAKNADGEVHIVLGFDLMPGAEIRVIIENPTDTLWRY